MLARVLQFWRSLLLIVASMVVGGAIVAALVWHWAYLLLIAIAVLTGMTLLLTPPFLLKLSGVVRSRSENRVLAEEDRARPERGNRATSRRPHNVRTWFFRHEAVHSRGDGLSSPHLSSPGAPRSPSPWLPFPGMRRSIETPLPSTPLIRVLETYDLSATDVEHFLDAPAERDTAELVLSMEREQESS